MSRPFSLFITQQVMSLTSGRCGISPMPEMSGVEVGLRICHQSRCSVLLVAAMDIQHFDRMLQQLRGQGCVCMALPLPFEISDLLVKPKAAVKGKEPHRSFLDKAGELAASYPRPQPNRGTEKEMRDLAWRRGRTEDDVAGCEAEMHEHDYYEAARVVPHPHHETLNAGSSTKLNRSVPKKLGTESAPRSREA